MLISDLFQNRSLKIWVCDRNRLDSTFTGDVQAKVKFVSSLLIKKCKFSANVVFTV